MRINELDTPALLVDENRVWDNIRYMQAYADKNHIALRPHTKTHKMPLLARWQMEAGACGVTVAKVGEAEVMAANGLKDIFIANEIVGEEKYRRIRAVAESSEISFGVDSVEQAKLVEASFAGAAKPAVVLVEIEVGENRSGVIEKDDFTALIKYFQTCRNIRFAGIFSHDGHSYGSASWDECLAIHLAAQKRTLEFAALAEQLGMPCERVSIGSTPSLMHDFPILPGVTEIRPGTYILMDAAQGNHLGSHERCAATVLTTIISRPTPERVITDVGAKGLTMQSRVKGLCATKGFGLVKGFSGVTVAGVYDEHAIILNRDFRDKVKLGDKIEIIPNHICPCVNLYDTAYLVRNGEVVAPVPVLCRGKLQ